MLNKIFGKKRKAKRANDCEEGACAVDDPLVAAFRAAGATEGAGGCCEPD